MSKVHFRTPYGPRLQVAISFDDPTLAQQNFRDQCDINNIIARWQKTGVVQHLNNFQAKYGDVSMAPTDYQEALNRVMHAESMFDALPATIRDRFKNDPAQFLAFTSNPANLDEMVALGIATRPQTAPSDAFDGPAEASAPSNAGEASSAPSTRSKKAT